MAAGTLEAGILCAHVSGLRDLELINLFLINGIHIFDLTRSNPPYGPFGARKESKMVRPRLLTRTDIILYLDGA
jgi:hypothetical protein